LSRKRAIIDLVDGGVRDHHLRQVVGPDTGDNRPSMIGAHDPRADETNTDRQFPTPFLQSGFPVIGAFQRAYGRGWATRRLAGCVLTP